MIDRRLKDRFSEFDVLMRDGKVYVHCGSYHCYVEIEDWPLNKRLMPRKKCLRPNGSEWPGMKVKDLFAQVQCPECGKIYDRIDWPTFPSSGTPRASCCLSTGSNNVKKYLERQKIINGETLFKCNKCNEHKHEGDFHKSKGRINSTCKKCHKSLYGHCVSQKEQKRKDEVRKKNEAKGGELLTCERCGKKTARKDWPRWKSNDSKLTKYCCISETERREIINKIREVGYSLCYTCEEFKPLFDFPMNNGKPQGYCKSCAIHLKKSQGKDPRESRQKAIQENSDSTLNAKSLIKLFSSFDSCPVCGNYMKRNDKTLDHIVPLSKGGMHSIHNSIIVCRSCNSSKGAKDFENWLSQLSWGKFITYYETVLGIPELSDVSKRIEQWLRQEALKLAQATMKQEPER